MIKSILLLFAEEDLNERVIKMYKDLFAKEFFMSFTNFEDMKQMAPNVGRLVREVIKKIQNEYGIQCDDTKAEEHASRTWQILRAEYEAER